MNTKHWTLSIAALAFAMAPGAIAQKHDHDHDHGDAKPEAKPSQEPVDEKAEKPRLIDTNPLKGQDPHEELRRLFAEVELRLFEIDELLIDASAGDTSKLNDLDESGIDKLLDEAQSQPSGGGGGASGVAGMLQHSSGQGEAVLSGIDRIIEIAQQNGTSCQSGSCSKPGSSSSDGSPLDKVGDQRTDKTKSPEGPSEQKPGEEQKQRQGDPKNPKDSNDPSFTEPAKKTPPSETAPAIPVVDPGDRWGDLPVHHRDIFRAEGGKKLPAQYRDWIDSYYRRLNARSND